MVICDFFNTWLFQKKILIVVVSTPKMEFPSFVSQKRLSMNFYHLTHLNIFGIVERKNRSIMNMVRSILKEKKLLNYFWGEAT